MKHWPLLLLGVFLLLFTWQSVAPPSREATSGSLPPASVSNAAPQRIVSLSPSNTEILYALGLDDKIVGVAHYSDFPPQALAKSQIGPYHAPDVEAIVALNPDLIVAAGEIQAPALRLLRRSGLRVVSVEPRTMPEIITAIQLIAAATKTDDAGKELCGRLVNKLETIRALTANSAAKPVFLEVWPSPLLTVGSDSYLNDLLQQAGGRNVAGRRRGDYVPWDLEEMYAADPEIYLLLGHKRQVLPDLNTRPELADLRAVRSHQVYIINDDLIARFGPRSFDGLQQVAEQLHPNAMKGVNEPQ